MPRCDLSFSLSKLWINKHKFRLKSTKYVPILKNLSQPLANLPKLIPNRTPRGLPQLTLEWNDREQPHGKPWQSKCWFCLTVYYWSMYLTHTPCLPQIYTQHTIQCVALSYLPLVYTHTTTFSQLTSIPQYLIHSISHDLARPSSWPTLEHRPTPTHISIFVFFDVKPITWSLVAWLGFFVLVTPDWE